MVIGVDDRGGGCRWSVEPEWWVKIVVLRQHVWCCGGKGWGGGGSDGGRGGGGGGGAELAFRASMSLEARAVGGSGGDSWRAWARMAD